MLWAISWRGDTRQRFQDLVRKRTTNFPLPGDIGELALKKVEEEIALHPIPSSDMAQVRETCTLRFSGVQVDYRIDSLLREAEILEVT